MMKIIIFLFLTFFMAASSANCIKHEHQPILDLDDYYSSTQGLDGHDLRRALNNIIGGHTRYSYTPCVWEILKEADEDPGNSDNVIGIYTGRSIPKSDQDSGQNDPNSWNREHIWAKSHGFPKQSQHAYTDAHHLRVADRSVNTSRNNRDFGEGGVPDDECTECFKGSGTWEPPDTVKGDIARMMFYMDVRYEGDDSSGTPDLRIIDQSNTESSKTLGRFGKLCTLLAWHVKDPVSEIEIQRNNIIQSWQGNRNPFIDRPAFAKKIWGRECHMVSADQSHVDDLQERLDRIMEELESIRQELETIR